MKLETFTLDDLRGLSQIAPKLSNFADRILVNSYETFVDVLHRDIDLCILQMEEEPKIRQNDCEDRLSTDIVNMLRCYSYDASREQSIGGHCDISVRHANGFLWLCEAKIHSSYEHLIKGFNQLCTRYSSGTPDTDKGGILIYIKNQNTQSVISAWRNKLSEMNLSEFYEWECPSRKELAFFSSHMHESSGRPYIVRHMGVVLHFDPKDR